MPDTILGNTYAGLNGKTVPVIPVDLASQVTGNLPVANLNGGAGATAGTFFRGDGAWSAVTYNNPLASPPSSPATGALWAPTDSMMAYRYTGSAWVPCGPFWTFSDPNQYTWSWVNQGSATLSVANGAQVLYANTVNSVACRVMSAPVTPYAITVLLIPTVYITTGQVQVGFRESSSGKLAALGILGNGTAEAQKWTNPTTFSANYTTVANAFPIGWFGRSPLWVKIEDTGVNRVISLCPNGFTWEPIHSVARTDFLTADQVYFGADQNTSGKAAINTVLSVQVS